MQRLSQNGSSCMHGNLPDEPTNTIVKVKVLTDIRLEQ